MARPKPRLPTCPIQLRCDGLTLRNGRTMCPSCAEALEPKRERPLRGERHLNYERTRRGPEDRHD